MVDETPEQRKVKLKAAMHDAFDFYFNQLAPDTDKQKKFMNLVTRTLKRMSFDASGEFGVGGCCPGWQECKDGRCAPPGEC